MKQTENVIAYIIRKGNKSNTYIKFDIIISPIFLQDYVTDTGEIVWLPRANELTLKKRLKSTVI